MTLLQRFKNHIDRPFVGRPMSKRMKGEDGFIQAALMAAPYVASALGGLFGKKSSGGDTVNTSPQWLLDLQQQLGGVVSKGLNDYTPGAGYGGNLNFAGTPTTNEQSSLDMLTKYLGAPGTGSLFDQAQGQVSDTLAGKFANPNTSPYIQAATKTAQNMLNSQISDARGRAGARGRYFTSSAIQSEDKLRGNTMDNLNAIIGQFQQNERQNQLGAANTAQAFDQYKNQTVPLQGISAGQQYGALPRLIQQANMESQYQDFLRQRTELTGNASTATTLSINQPNITPGKAISPVTQGNNAFGNIMDLISGKGMAAPAAGQTGILQQLMGAMGGGAGGTGGIDISKLAQIVSMAAGGMR